MLIPRQVVTDLSTATFLLACPHFVTRRSLTVVMMSRNASMYTSPTKELSNLWTSGLGKHCVEIYTEEGAMVWRALRDTNWPYIDGSLEDFRKIWWHFKHSVPKLRLA